MINLIFYLVSLSASCVGAICGVGGGVFIKPLLDALGVLPVNTITFLSTCTVVSMSSYNVLSSKKGESVIDWKLTTWLAVGAAIGGIVGKNMYSTLKNQFANPDIVGGYQAIALFVVVFLTLIYTLNKSKIKSIHVTNQLALIGLGFSLGCASSFLGIGGGPMNLAVLCYFLSMDMKVAAQNSLYIILVSQIASLSMTFMSKSYPTDLFHILDLLVGMMICGVLGGVIGKKVNKKIPTETVDKLFVILIYVILALCIYNTVTKFGLI